MKHSAGLQVDPGRKALIEIAKLNQRVVLLEQKMELFLDGVGKLSESEDKKIKPNLYREIRKLSAKDCKEIYEYAMKRSAEILKGE
jgi:hypothetical protein